MSNKIKSKCLKAGIAMLVLLQAAAGYSTELNQEDGIMTNHSTEYVRTLNRNTSTDPDAAFYNPAGLVFMAKDGLHINFSSQTYHVKKTHTLDFYALKIGETGSINPTPHSDAIGTFEGTLPDEYGAELTAPVLPGFDIVWKQDKWAVFFDLAVMQAATNMIFGDGLAVLDWGNLLAFETTFDPSTQAFITFSSDPEAVRNEMYIGITLGGAYEIMNWLSAGGGLRIIHASGNMQVKINDVQYLRDTTPLVADGLELKNDAADEWDLDTDYEGFGFGIILSTHIRPEGLVPVLKGLDATLRFEYYLPMELEKKNNSFKAPVAIEQSGNVDIFKDGTADPSFNGGGGYASPGGNGTKILKTTYAPTLNLGLSYMLFDWIKLLSSGQISFRQMRDLDGREDDYNVGFQVGAGVEFILNQKITLSTGYLYNNFGIKPEARTEADMLLDSHQLGAGAKFSVDENLDINIGAFYQYFVPVTVGYVKYVHVTEPTWSYLKKDYEEARYSVSIGATYRMFSSDSSSGSGFVDDKDDVKSKKKDKQVK
ncbi:MAG: porin family protein [Spirochaetes bacterium]|nr:porin family protein [Spirochaetota bacterium]